jgi:hypothetical protein
MNCRFSLFSFLFSTFLSLPQSAAAAVSPVNDSVSSLQLALSLFGLHTSPFALKAQAATGDKPVQIRITSTSTSTIKYQPANIININISSTVLYTIIHRHTVKGGLPKAA